MNYKLLFDENELDKFLNILPDDDDKDIVYLLSLFARKKYDTTGKMSNDKSQLKTVLTRKADIKKKIKQLETPIGSYIHKDFPVPQESLALYIMPNPRSHRTTGLNMLAELSKKVRDGHDINPKALMNSMYQVSPSLKNKKFFDVDVDLSKDATYKDISILTELIKPIEDAVNIVVTRGGFHLLLDIDKVSFKNWYMHLNTFKDENISVMMNGDALVPLPGCTQGGFIPKLIK
jgi:hypothetical protein